MAVTYTPLCHKRITEPARTHKGKRLMGKPLRVLVVEDSEHDTTLLLHYLRRSGYEPQLARLETAADLERALQTQQWDVIISDYSLPTFDALTALEITQKSALDIPFIVVSGSIGEETAVAMMKAGAHDYVMKDNLVRLGSVIERELREAAGRRERKNADETIRYLAYYDILTDLPNRTLFQDRLDQAVLAAKREHKPLVLLVMDLDRFKEVNDSLGHYAGDLLLREAGHRLRYGMRASDTVGRLGGDEFALLLPGVDREGATVAAVKVREMLEQPFIIEGQSLGVEASVGIALYPEHGEDAATLLRRADVAMYAAKTGNLGQAVYDRTQDQHSPARLALLNDLHEALEESQLVLHYQPRVNLRSRRVSGVEALVRWQHPLYGLLPPEQFIPLAEQTGVIKSLSLWVLKAALSQAQAWRDAEFDSAVAVNLTMRNLQDPQTPDTIQGLLAEIGLDGRWLTVEITEDTVMSNAARALETLTRLRAMGVRIAIDDFGTGYSSLGYLKRLPVDELKIDQSFVRDMATDQNSSAIVRATIDLGHNLGLQVVAEGVEDEPTLDLLSRLGCDEAQGYYFSRALPPSDFLHWYLDQQRLAAPLHVL